MSLRKSASLPFSRSYIDAAYTKSYTSLLLFRQSYRLHKGDGGLNGRGEKGRGKMGKIPFNSELIRTVPIFLFISSCRVLISNRLHNAARPRGRARARFNARTLSRSSILLESIEVYFPLRTGEENEGMKRGSENSSFARGLRGQGARATCIRFSISNFPAGTPHNAMSLIQRTIYPPESIDKTHNTRIRIAPPSLTPSGHLKRFRILRSPFAFCHKRTRHCKFTHSQRQRFAITMVSIS